MTLHEVPLHVQASPYHDAAPAEIPRAEKVRWSRADYVLTAALSLAAFLFAEWYLPVYRAAGGVAQFYQDQFGPAVMLACGRGFVNVDSPSVRAFDDFLKQRTSSLRCDELPPAIRPVPLSGFQGSSRYLMSAAALVWRATGVRFGALDALIAGFFAAAIGAAYAAVRIGCGRAIALIVVVLWALSYRHLENLPHLRDYSKAPFFMLMLVAMGVAVYERKPRRLVVLGAVFGAIQGLGFGMRTDVALNFVPFFLVLFAAGSVEGRRAVRPRMACATASLVVFAVIALPILQSYARSSSLWHVVLLGFTAPYDENLNIGFPRPAYSFPYAHNDSYIESVVRAYWRRLHPNDPLLTMVTRPYDRACEEYFFRLARAFPADMLTRGVASIVGIVNLPFSLPDGYVPVGVSNPTLRNAWEVRGRIGQAISGSGLLLIAAVLTMLAFRAPLYAAVAFVLLWFWGAFPAVEFQGRHIFHVEVVVLAAIAWGCAAIVRVIAGAVDRSAWRRAMWSSEVPGRFARAAATVALLFAIAGATVVSARAYQIPSAHEFVRSYDAARETPVAAAAVPLSGETVRLAVDLFHPPDAREQVEEVLLKATFDFAQCGHPPAVKAVFRYDVSDPWLSAFSREAPLEDLGAPPTRIFLPVYLVVRDWNVAARFAGVDVPSTFARCVRLSRVDDTRALPLLLPVTIAPDWQRKLYQRVRFGSGLGY